MSKSKNRFIEDGLVHFIRRDKTRHYFIKGCDGRIVNNVTDWNLMVTCLWCVSGAR